MPGKSIDNKTVWSVPTTNGKPDYDPSTGEKKSTFRRRNS